MIQSICVFCGSSNKAKPIYRAAARDLGICIAKRNMQLVYGGGNVGTMGELADAAMKAGGKVIGIIPRQLNEQVEHLELTQLLVVGDMHERKALMQEKADAFIALPGGIGTMEELFEVWTWRYIGLHFKPVGLLNIGGFYDKLLDFLGEMSSEGFLQKEILADLCIADSSSSMIDALIERNEHKGIRLLKTKEIFQAENS
ncbi:MAG: TIGR00730 family Rossman fold protein [Spirochaetaceae bacterium]|nr:TIGR00730 family Rossman fold protein [Spirochaetaceae bacterium]